MANSTVAVTAGSGTSIATFADSNSYQFQRVLAGPEGSQNATYFASYTAQSVGTGATTNILTFAGSATKTIRVTRILLSATATTAATYFDVLLRKQTTADTGGTAATTATILKAEVADATATAVAPIFYTAGPTAGTVTGTLLAVKLFAPITGTPAPVTAVEPLGQRRGAKPLTLSGVTDILTVTLNGVTPANATSWDVHVEWNEV